MTAPDTAPIANNPHSHAHHYAANNLRVIPIRPGGKYPPVPEWQNAATTDPNTIDHWWTTEYPNHGVGLAMGPQPDGRNLIAVDIDEHKPEASGSDTLHQLEALHSKLPDTVRAITGSGGTHLIYCAPPTLDLRNTAGTIGPGIDIRGAGGQIVAAPSIHPDTLRRYEWEDGYAPWEHPIADAPEWLLELACPPRPQPAERPGGTYVRPGQAAQLDPTPADLLRREWNWARTLQRDGWTLHKTDHTGDTHWTRPGKNPRNGSSGVLHEPDGPFVLFSTDPTLHHHRRIGTAVKGGGIALSPLHYYAAHEHGGDMAAASRTIRGVLDTPSRPTAPPTSIGTTTGGANIIDPDDLDPAATELVDDLTRLLVNWRTFWDTDHSAEDWLIEPLIAAHRGHVIFAKGGTGKSLLSLFISAQAATGRGLHGRRIPPIHVLYLDYEMTESDLAERLDNMGYGPDSDLTRLHYAVLPSIDPLDTAAGGQTVARLAELVDANLVVIDTLSRAVAGDENEADTIRAFYAHCGLALKQAGRAFVRIDHAGKDDSKGARGTSAKNDDVDVVWQLSAGDNGAYTATVKKRRMPWVRETIDLVLRDDPTRWELADGGAMPTGTTHLADQLDTLKVPLDASVRTARKTLTDAGHKAANKTLSAALRYRRERGLEPPKSVTEHVRNTSPGTVTPDETEHSVTPDKTPGQTVRNTRRNTAEHPPSPVTASVPPYKGAHAASRNQTDLDEATEPATFNPFA